MHKLRFRLRFGLRQQCRCPRASNRCPSGCSGPAYHPGCCGPQKEGIRNQSCPSIIDLTAARATNNISRDEVNLEVACSSYKKSVLHANDCIQLLLMLFNTVPACNRHGHIDLFEETAWFLLSCTGNVVFATCLVLRSRWVTSFKPWASGMRHWMQMHDQQQRQLIQLRGELQEWLLVRLRTLRLEGPCVKI